MSQAQTQQAPNGRAQRNLTNVFVEDMRKLLSASRQNAATQQEVFRKEAGLDPLSEDDDMFVGGDINITQAAPQQDAPSKAGGLLRGLLGAGLLASGIGAPIGGAMIANAVINAAKPVVTSPIVTNTVKEWDSKVEMRLRKNPAAVAPAPPAESQ